jgi:hypothetical protein
MRRFAISIIGLSWLVWAVSSPAAFCASGGGGGAGGGGASGGGAAGGGAAGAGGAAAGSVGGNASGTAALGSGGVGGISTPGTTGTGGVNTNGGLINNRTPGATALGTNLVPTTSGSVGQAVLQQELLKANNPTLSNANLGTGRTAAGPTTGIPGQTGVNTTQAPTGAAGSVVNGTSQINPGMGGQGRIGGQLTNPIGNQLTNRNNDWRWQYFNGLWWYWMPNTNQWTYFQNGDWHLFAGPVEGVSPNATSPTNNNTGMSANTFVR